MFKKSLLSGTVYGTLLNFRSEYEALQHEMNEPPYNAPPQKLVLYIKPTNTIISHMQPIPLPKGEKVVQIGAGLGVVIGKNATQLTKENAFDYVAGYTIVNDVSIPHESFYRPDIRNKVRDGFCPVGPRITDRNEVPNPDQLTIRVYVNEEIVQESNTGNLIRSVANLLTEVTEFMTLYKGDILLVGVPENPPKVRSGDKIRIDISQLGSLENTVVEEEKLPIGGGQK